jgi:hypothetical protein|nr:MAG TPA: hypothetical protein [Caudoviricetes sp.]
MNRKEAAELLPIIKAFSEGKEIEGLYKGTKSPWFKIKDMHFNEGIIFRIKSEPKYRPFKNAEECWQEMLKHQPFGWVKSTLFKDLDLVQRVTTLYVEINREIIDYKDALDNFTFADDTNFGVKVE